MLRPYQQINRRKSRVIKVGNVSIGGNNQIAVQTMTNTLTSNAKDTIAQIERSAKLGVDLVRVSVPDKDSSIKISMDNLSIDESIVSFTTNESDAYALEEALQIKEKTDGEVVICTFGKDSAIQVVKDGLAKGADRAIFISNMDKENLDILSV